MKYKIRKFPPLWYLPTILTTGLKMALASKQKKFHKAVRHGKELMTSEKSKKRAFLNYSADEHDVFICTFSKSGTYWMMNIVSQIADRGDANFEHIHYVVPWPDQPFDNVVLLSEPTWKHTKEKKRGIKTHLESEYLPYSEDSQYIVGIRDPKDVVISGYYFADSIITGLSSIGLQQWLELFVNGETPFSSWPSHIASFWPWRDRPNVHFVRFRDLKADLPKAITEISKLMNIELSETELDKVVSKSVFSAMKAEQEKFKPPIPPGIDKSTVNILREGNTDIAKKELTEEEMAYTDQRMKAELASLNCDFPYDEYFG